MFNFRKIANGLELAGNISKNVLDIGALLAGIAAVIVYISGNSPVQRVIDSLTNDQRLSNANGWVWLGDGNKRFSYYFVLQEGQWIEKDNVELPSENSIIRATATVNVRSAAGPSGDKLSYLVRGDCIKVIKSKNIGWGWAKIKPTICPGD